LRPIKEEIINMWKGIAIIILGILFIAGSLYMISGGFQDDWAYWVAYGVIVLGVINIVIGSILVRIARRRKK
jgi:hypothetical protein